MNLCWQLVLSTVFCLELPKRLISSIAHYLKLAGQLFAAIVYELELTKQLIDSEHHTYELELCEEYVYCCVVFEINCLNSRLRRLVSNLTDTVVVQD